jgi:hypothetical protein
MGASDPGLDLIYDAGKVLKEAALTPRDGGLSLSQTILQARHNYRHRLEQSKTVAAR